MTDPTPKLSPAEVAERMAIPEGDELGQALVELFSIPEWGRLTRVVRTYNGWEVCLDCRFDDLDPSGASLGNVSARGRGLDLASATATASQNLTDARAVEIEERAALRERKAAERSALDIDLNLDDINL